MKHRAEEKGFALVAVLWISIILASMVLSAAYIARLELRKANFPLREMQALALASGGIEVVKAELLSDDNKYDYLSEKWKKNPDAYENVKIGESVLNVSVDDEESRLNINISPRAILENFDPVKLMPNAQEALDSVSDWQDADSNSALCGAEEEYYQHIDNPIHCKNGPLDCIDELNLIRGFNDESFRELPSKTMSVFSSGKVNINTAPVEVLQALPLFDSKLALQIVAHRAGPDSLEGTEDDQPFTSSAEVVEFLGNEVFKAAGQHIVFCSIRFRVRSTAVVGRISRTVEAMLERTGAEIKIRYWREL
ncbi:MAG: hypothetical protein ABII64_02520 [Elusimicrobiota bacterium]